MLCANSRMKEQRNLFLVVATKSFKHFEHVIFLESCETSKCESLTGCMKYFILAIHNIKQVVGCHFLEELQNFFLVPC